MMRGLFNHLRSDRRGSAAVEFALWSAMFFTAVMPALDFGDLYIKRSRVNDAVDAAAVQSFQTRDNVSFNDLQAYVRALSNDTAVTVTATCNGSGTCTNASRTCACLQTNGTYVAAASCGATCGSGSTANSTSGYYLTITASRNYTPMVLPRSVASGTRVRKSATIRLQ